MNPNKARKTVRVFLLVLAIMFAFYLTHYEIVVSRNPLTNDWLALIYIEIVFQYYLIKQKRKPKKRKYEEI